jgi:hypothetical protein
MLYHPYARPAVDVTKLGIFLNRFIAEIPR